MQLSSDWALLNSCTTDIGEQPFLQGCPDHCRMISRCPTRCQWQPRS